MNFNKHYNVEGKHAFLSASSYHWINYDENKLLKTYYNQQAKLRGTQLHQFACDAINYGIPLAEDGSTISMYVNDCIKDGLSPEVVLYYSPNAFGTADSISFEDNILRIYDLKTGKTQASMNQLEVYAGLFCLEYSYNPIDIFIHLRLYQNEEVIVHEPESDRIWFIMDKIIAFDNLLQELQSEV